MRLMAQHTERQTTKDKKTEVADRAQPLVASPLPGLDELKPRYSITTCLPLLEAILGILRDRRSTPRRDDVSRIPVDND